MRRIIVASVVGVAVLIGTAACGQQTATTEAATPVRKAPVANKPSPTAAPPSAAEPTTSPTEKYPLTPTSVAGVKLPFGKSQVEQLTKRLGEPRVVTTPHCEAAAKEGLKGRQLQWGDLTVATDPLKNPEQYSYWFLTGRSLPANLEPDFALGVDGTLDALQETYPNSKYSLSDTYLDSTLTGEGLPVWRENNGKVLSAQSRSVECLDRR